jgi:hypothetical protein
VRHGENHVRLQALHNVLIFNINEVDKSIGKDLVNSMYLKV